MSDNRSEELMTEDQIKYMVDRFLGWRLPETFAPDAGISFKAEYNEHTAYPMKHEPTGTNLLDATQAEVMVRHMVEGMPASDALERAERDLRAAAATEAAMREAVNTYFERIEHGDLQHRAWLRSMHDEHFHTALSTPASALAQRYEAVVTALKELLSCCETCGIATPRGFDATRKARAALDHPTPTKDDEA